MQSITKEQIGKIYAIGNALGIVERGNESDDLHTLVEATAGKSSIRELTFTEAIGVISELQRRQGGAKPPQRKRAKAHPEVAGGATDGQQRKVWALMYELQKLDATPSRASLGERLCGIIKKDLKIDAMPQNPFAWLDFKAADKLIEVVKKYVANAQGQKAGDNT